MRDREAYYQQQRRWHLFYSVIMLLCAVGFLFGLVALAVFRQLSVDIITYCLIIAILASPFFFIVRTRYQRAKLAYAAIQYAKGKSGHAHD